MYGSLERLQLDVDLRAPGSERIVGHELPVRIIARDVLFGEGPVWDARNRQFFYTDIIGDTIWRWTFSAGSQPVLRPSHKANGLALDLENRLVVAGWGGRTVFRLEEDGSRTTLASHWEGKKLNSPNDVVVRSDGSLYFTDSEGGLLNVGMVGDDLQRYLPMQGVFRIAPDRKELVLLTDEVVYPNGLCFSPDEKLLYVNCSRERVIRVYDVKRDGSVGKGRIFFRYTGPERGVPDGMKCDAEGNVYCTGPGGIYVHSPGGDVLARIRFPGHHPTNFAWGDDDGRSLYVTLIGSVVRTRLNIAGASRR